MRLPSAYCTIAVAGLVANAPSAALGAWCAEYRTGGTNCGFSSFSQCQATISGAGGFCNQIGGDQAARSSKPATRREASQKSKGKTVAQSQRPVSNSSAIRPAVVPDAVPAAKAAAPAVPAASPAAAPLVSPKPEATAFSAPAAAFDAQAFAAARTLILEGQYQEGLTVLQLLGADHHPDVASHIGLAYRKLGRNADARAWYDRALAADPKHLQTLAFSGVLRAEQGDLGGARLDLQKIRLVCGNTTCNEYVGLAGVIADKAR